MILTAPGPGPGPGPGILSLSMGRLVFSLPCWSLKTLELYRILHHQDVRGCTWAVIISRKCRFAGHYMALAQYNVNL